MDEERDGYKDIDGDEEGGGGKEKDAELKDVVAELNAEAAMGA